MTYNVDGKRLIDFLHTAEVNDEKASSMLKQLGRSVLEVPYADLVADPAVAEEWWNTILEFLGIFSITFNQSSVCILSSLFFLSPH